MMWSAVIGVRDGVVMIRAWGYGAEVPPHPEREAADARARREHPEGYRGHPCPEAPPRQPHPRAASPMGHDEAADDAFGRWLATTAGPVCRHPIARGGA